MPKVTVFLDVDETCVISNALYGQKDGGYRYNDVLFAALKNCQCTELYLLTSFDLASVSRNLQDEVVATPSRLKLIQYLEQQGFKVQGVITSLDVVFKQGIGAYYEKVIKPYEMRVVEGEDFRIGNAAQAYQADCEKEKSLVEKAHITGLKVGDKGGLYRYFIEVQRNVLLYSTFKVIFVDDRPGYLTDIKNANQEYGYPLCLIQAKPQDTSSYYQKLLSDFQYDLEREYVTQQLERIKALTLDKTQDEAYQTLQKEFKQIFSIPPDLLDLRNLSMKMTYFLTQLENSKNFYSKAQDALFDNPLLQDKHAERLIADIKAMPGVTELLDTSQPEATLYGLEKPYGISLKTARDMLHRINKTGNSHVGRVGNVFFKQDPKYSLVEQAIYQLSRLFGEGAVTPTRLLLLEIPNDQTYALQASLGVGVDGNIDAIDLDALCQIPETIAMLKQDVGEALLVQDFERLLTNDYYQTWLSKRGFNVDMSLEKQCTVLLESLLKLPQDCWPVGLKEFYDQPEAQKSKLLHAALQEAFQDDKRAPLRLLALLERYPALSKHPLNHLIACSDVFECLRFLYPSLSAKAVLKETESLFKYIDKANLSIHLLLEMVSDPQDHKGDNFKAQFRRNSDGNLIAPLEIIAIDNDDAMKGTFKSKKGEHLLLVKSLLLANSALLNESIAESVRERCLLIHPKVAMMQWLESLNQYYEPYYALKERGIIFKGLSQALLLEEQVPVDFIGRLLERLEVIQNSLKQGTITHKILWHQVEPLLAYSYEALSRQSPGSEALMTALYHKKKPVFLGNVLKADLAKTLDSGKTLSDLIAALPLATKNNGYRSYIETLTEYVSGSLTANHPFQVQALTLCMRLKFYHITLPPEGLILSPADLIKTYRQAPQKWVNLIKSCPKVSIQFQTPIPFSHPLILYYALSEPEGPLLVEALLASGVPANQVRSEDGLTPLHFAASFYPNCIPALIAGGAQTECTNAEGLTPLDLSMHSNQYKAVILLLQGGAGRNLKAPLGLAFIKAYQKLCPELCQSLLSRNIAMAWYSALETISQESPTQEVVASMGGVQNKRYLRLEIYRDIFKKGSIFPKDNIHGVRSVTAIQCKIAEGIHVGLHLKKDPELPGREIMVHVLAKHLFGFITPSIALWRFTKKTLLKKEVAYPVLASRSIKGKNLLEVLKKNPEQLKKLDKQSAYQAIILAMMINPEDGRPDNYIMEPFSKGSEIAYRLVSIDNDHAFVRPIALKKSGAELTGTKALQVKTILYCLEEMQDALPSEMVNQLLTNNPYELLRGWLIELQQQQQEIDELFNEKEKKELLKQDIHLNILFKFSVIEDVYQKLCRLQTVLRESPKTPLLRILRVVIPELWIRYAGIFSQYPTPLERFNVLAKDAFDTRVITIEGERHLYLESTAKASQVIQMTGSLRDEEKALKEEKEDTSGTALLRLDKLYAECSAIAEIAAELQKGKVDRFKKLPSIHQEKIVNGDGTLPGIDFNTMLVAGNPDIKRQQTVLSALRDVSFRVLKIRNLTVLTDKQLSAFLQENKGLLALNLEGCSGLTDAAARIIEDNCPNLEKLFINKLSWSQVSLSLPHLRVLYVQECGKLRSWEIKAPSKIDRLYFKNCQLLCNLGVYSTELRELELQNCPKLPENQLLKLAANTTFLKKVELAACLAISNANFYRKYPKLLNFSLQDFSNEFVERLDAGMAIILKEVGMSAAMIQPLMIEKLQENVILWQRFKRTLFFPALLKVLEDKDPEVRNCVCETLSKLPLTAEDREIVLPALLKTLEDTDSDVRNCAVQALSNLLLLTVKDINTVLPLLLKALRDKSRAFKNGVCEALSKLPLTGNDMATVLPVLLNLLENEYADVRISAAQAFSTLPLRPENIATVWPVFLKMLADENEKVRSHVCNALSKLPLTDEDFTVVLAALLKQLVDKNRTIRSGACEALSKLPLAAKNIATVLPPLLIMALDDEHAEVRSHACEALSNLSLMAVDAARVLPVLLKALADAEADVRGHACEALSKLALSTKDQITVVSALTKVVEDEDEYEYVSASAAQALSTLSLKAEDVAAVTPDLKALGDVKSSAEVVQSRLSLATSDEKIKQLPELLKALEDENGTVSSKSAAAQALLKLPLTVEDKILVVLPTLLMSLENPSFETRNQMLGLLVIFYPLMQEMVEACCQKFKKATRPPIVTQSAPAESTHQKEGLLSVHIHSSHQQMNVSGQGNNCGLFALILGIKKGLEHKPQLRNTTRLPEFFDAIDIAWLRPDTEAKETGEVGMKLRQAMADTLLKDAQYKARRYHNVVAACREFLEGEPSALDMQAWLAVTRGYREPLKQEWREISDVLEKSYNTVEADYRQLLSNNPLNLDYIGQLKEQLCKQVMDKPQSKVLNALLDAYYPTESHSMLGLIKLRCLYRAAWLGVTVSTGLERNGVSDCMEKLFKKKILTILQQQGVSESPENLLLFSLLEKTNFDQSGILVGNGIAAREEVLSTAAALFVENDLVHHWDFLYQNYCVHIKTTPAMLSADELGCLARCWNIRLKIQFAYGEPYKTEEMIDSEQLQVTLCNPSQMHWNVVCESGAHFDMRWNSSTIVMLILGIENIEYRTYITDAINNEIAYAKRSEDCSYVVGVVSAIQETPYVLLQQGVSLSAADFNAAKGLSQYFEEGFLRLNAEQIYFLKGLLSKNIFESSAVVSVAKWVDELSLTENRLLFDYNNTFGAAGMPPRLSAVTHTRSRRAEYKS